jgi:hypothetical protein
MAAPAPPPCILPQVSLDCVLLAILSILAISPGNLPAQFARAERVGLTPLPLMAERGPQKFAMPKIGGKSYWKEGGAVTAIAAIILANTVPLREGRNTVIHRALGSLGAAAVFFWPGALIGKQFPKD